MTISPVVSITRSSILSEEASESSSFDETPISEPSLPPTQSFDSTTQRIWEHFYTMPILHTVQEEGHPLFAQQHQFMVRQDVLEGRPTQISQEILYERPSRDDLPVPPSPQEAQFMFAPPTLHAAQEVRHPLFAQQHQFIVGQDALEGRPTQISQGILYERPSRDDLPGQPSRGALFMFAPPPRADLFLLQKSSRGDPCARPPPKKVQFKFTPRVDPSLLQKSSGGDLGARPQQSHAQPKKIDGYLCPASGCGQRLAEPGYLKKHVQGKHPELLPQHQPKQFKCTIPGCRSQGYSRRSDLTQHLWKCHVVSSNR